MATKTDVKLLGIWPSPYVNRVQIALSVKSIDYEFVVESYLPKSELLLKSNPVHKKIPVFFHGDKTICETLVIIQYVDEWFPLVRELRTVKGEEARALAERIVEGLVLLEETFVKCSKGKAYF
ncbi:hypothetical protein RJ640_012679, partial [Escallonia rubra]